MAIVVKDRVKETFTTTGTADFTLIGAVVGFQAFSAIGNTNFTYYAAVDPSTGAWEVGYGQYQTSGPTLTRNTILSSSAAGAKVSFGAGVKDVFCTYPSEKAIYEELAGNVLIDGGPLTVVGSGVTSYTSFGAALAEMYANETAFAQMYVQNLNSSATASTDIVAYNNLGDGTNNFIDMGISSSSYSDPTYPIFTAGSGYLYNDGGELIIGSATDDVVLFAGGVALSDEAVRIDKTSKDVTTVADVNVGGALDVNGAADIAGAAVFGSTVTLNANPTLALQAATKSYVDNQVTAGLHIHEPVRVETTGNLTATYTQGGTTFNITDITSTTTVTTSVNHGLSVNDQIWLYTSAGNGLSTNTAYFVFSIPALNQLTLSLTFDGAQITGLTNASGLTYATRANSGVGATLTNSGAQAALSIDGIAMATTNRVMVRLQTNGAENGVYTVTTVGTGATNWVLTRATDSNQVNPADPNGVGTGDYYFTREGLLNAGDSHVLTTEPNTMILGYTALTYTQFSGGVLYTGGTNINVTGQVISLTGTVAPTNGGTGVNTVTTGDLLYGSATNTWSKLPLGGAYRSLVVNGAGNQVEWNAVALDQSGAVSGTLPVGNGGTGINSYAQGEMLFANTTTSLDKVTANTTTTKKFLSQTGNGTAGLAPTWAQPAASDITGLAPSATTDTTDASNITSGTLGTSRLSGSYTGVTGVGTLTAGTWNATAIGAVYGGTGLTSYAVGDLLYADTTTSLAKLADVAVGNALISGGVSAAPSWGKIGLATHVSGTLPIANGGTGSTSTTFVSLTTNVTGTLPVGNGGTGAATFTANNVLLGNGTSAFQVVAPGTNGNVLQSNGTTWVSAAAPSTMVYPGAGIANSTGTSWGTSYSTSGSGTVVALTDSPIFTGNVTGPNFCDATGSYNVNLGSGGTAGRGVVAGYSGGSYGGIGYNVTHTATGGVYTAPSSDTSSYLRFASAGFTFLGAAAGAAGRTLSYTSLATLNSSGNFAATGTVAGTNITSAGNVTGNAATATTATNQSGGTVSATTGAFTSTLTSTSGFTNVDNALRIFAPGGGSYATGASTVTGAIKIRIPTAALGSNTMMSFKVKVYQYSTGFSNEFQIGGYNYSDGAKTWYNVSATALSQSQGALNVRFGFDGTSQCIYIGELASTWSYPQVVVTDFIGGYSGYTAAIWASGWSVGFETSAFAGVTQTVATGFTLNSVNCPIAYNSGTTYGGIAQTVDKGGYYGYLMGTTTSHLQIMADGSGNGGFYRQASGWPLYYLVANGGIGIMTSTTSSSYAMYVAGSIYATANVVAYSDRRAKKDIVTIDNALEKTNKLRGVYYKKIEEDIKDEAHHDKRQMGVIAQEVLEIAPEVVTYDKENDKYGVAYANMAGLFIEAIKELTDKVATLEAKLEQLTKDKS